MKDRIEIKGLYQLARALGHATAAGDFSSTDEAARFSVDCGLDGREVIAMIPVMSHAAAQA